jgi:hypothetical protein
VSGFIIDQVSWHTKVAGNPETRAHIVARFWAVANFLQNNGLTHRKLVQSPSDIGDEFAISSVDLTERGLALMKKVYDKWLTKVDEGASPDDMSMFEKQLSKA